MRDTLYSCIVSLVVLVAEGALLMLFHLHIVTAGSAVAGHVTLVSALGLWAFLCSRAGRDLRIPLVLAITTAVLGPFGPLGTLCILSLLPFYSRNAKTFEEWHSSLFPRDEITSTQALFNHIGRAGEDQASGQSSVTPFTDVLAFGTLEQKLLMISLIAKHFSPTLGPVLRMALNDPSNAIRVQAATAMAVIEEDFLKRTLGIEVAAMHRPDHPETLKMLARHYDHYANTGILDEQREQENRQKALQAYRKYLGFNPDDMDVRLDVGLILLKNRSFAEAAEWFEACLQDGFTAPGMVLGYMESLFHLGRFQDLRNLARSEYAELTRADAYPTSVMQAVKLWTADTTSGDDQGGPTT
ncbi:MAG: tetratricopeptide repeat protein [Candidatus Binatia bacterium]